MITHDPIEEMLDRWGKSDRQRMHTFRATILDRLRDHDVDVEVTADIDWVEQAVSLDPENAGHVYGRELLEAWDELEKLEEMACEEYTTEPDGPDRSEP